MEIINTIFRIGVILAIFGFIWFFIQLAFQLLLNSGQNKSIYQVYGIKFIQYILLVQVTLLFCFEKESNLSLSASSVGITGFILAFYFVSKLQRNQERKQIFSFMQNGNPINLGQNFNQKAEIGVIVASLAFFVTCLFLPTIIENKITIWFKESILSIENAAFFGFIFKIVGFFFLLSVFNKIVQAISMLVSPQGIKNNRTDNQIQDDDHFDNFEDLSDK